MPLEAQTRLLRVLQQGEFVPGRRPPRGPRQRPHRRGQPPRSPAAGRPGRVPRGSVLPAERRPHPPAGRCASGSTTSRPWSSIFLAKGAGRRPAAEDADARGDGAPQVARLARQRPRAREPGPAPRRPLRRGHDRRGRDRARARAGPAAGAGGRGGRPTTASAGRSSATSTATSARTPAACRRQGSTTACCARSSVR